MAAHTAGKGSAHRGCKLTIPDSVESAGQYRPQDLIPEAIAIMLDKISEVEKGLDRLFDVSGAAA
jgi:hypothetical protein